MKINGYQVIHIKSVSPPSEIHGILVVAEIYFIKRLVIVRQVVCTYYRYRWLVSCCYWEFSYFKFINSHCRYSGTNVNLRRANIVGITGIIVYSAVEIEIGANKNIKTRCEDIFVASHHPPIDICLKVMHCIVFNWVLYMVIRKRNLQLVYPFVRIEEGCTNVLVAYPYVVAGVSDWAKVGVNIPCFA